MKVVASLEEQLGAAKKKAESATKRPRRNKWQAHKDTIDYHEKRPRK